MDCLVTKLKGNVDDSSLLKLGEIRFIKRKTSSWDAATQRFDLAFNKDVDLYIIGDGYFTDKTGTVNNGTKFSAKSGDNVFYVSNTSDIEISVSDKYSLTKINLKFNSSDGWSSDDSKDIKGGYKSLEYCQDMTLLGIDTIPISGDISFMKQMKDLNSVIIKNNSVYGDISVLSDKSKLSNCTITSVNVTGDISSYPANSYTELSIPNSVTGDIKNFKAKDVASLLASNSKIQGDVSNLNLHSLSTLYLYNSSGLYGNINFLSNSPNIKTFWGYTTKITGDISVLESLNSIYSFDCGNCTFTGDYFRMLSLRNYSVFLIGGEFSYSTKNYSGKEYGRIGGDSFTCENLDNFLNDFKNANAINNSGSIKMSGNRTSASDAAISALQEKGFTVAVPAATDANAISLMSAMSAKSVEIYRIAYKGSELIVEPTTLQIYPASGVTVKTFSSVEEANDYIKSNGLKKAESI